jgi:hypothetical protein
VFASVSNASVPHQIRCIESLSVLVAFALGCHVQDRKSGRTSLKAVATGWSVCKA